MCNRCNYPSELYIQIECAYVVIVKMVANLNHILDNTSTDKSIFAQSRSTFQNCTYKTIANIPAVIFSTTDPVATLTAAPWAEPSFMTGSLKRTPVRPRTFSKERSIQSSSWSRSKRTCFSCSTAGYAHHSVSGNVLRSCAAAGENSGRKRGSGAKASA